MIITQNLALIRNDDKEEHLPSHEEWVPPVDVESDEDQDNDDDEYDRNDDDSRRGVAGIAGEWDGPDLTVVSGEVFLADARNLSALVRRAHAAVLALADQGLGLRLLLGGVALGALQMGRFLRSK